MVDFVSQLNARPMPGKDDPCIKVRKMAFEHRPPEENKSNSVVLRNLWHHVEAGKTGPLLPSKGGFLPIYRAETFNLN
jgi:hypothetical protein